MNLVVDASVAIKWFVRESLYDDADRLLLGDHELSAPDFLVIELANIAWKKAVRKEIGPQQAELIPEACVRNIRSLYPSPDLVGRATSIAIHLNHPVYDCLYLACAEEVDGIVVTADKRFRHAVRNTPFAPMVRDLRGLASG